MTCPCICMCMCMYTYKSNRDGDELLLLLARPDRTSGTGQPGGPERAEKSGTAGSSGPVWGGVAQETRDCCRARLKLASYACRWGALVKVQLAAGM
jgi:hypothetical protein